jgi:apolipoprotein N-acyltransferase
LDFRLKEVGVNPKRFITDMKSKIQNLKSKIYSGYPPSEGTFSEEDILAAKFRVTKVLPFQQASPPFLNNLWLAVVSGFLLVLAFPNWSLWSLGWVGVAPLIMGIAREQKFWRSFWLGLTTGTIFYAGSSPWITYSMNNYGGIPLWVCYILLMVIAVILASFMALFAGVLGYTIKSFGGWAILSAPVLWATSEWLRLQLTGMGWNALGYSQAFQPILIQISRFGGVYLVSAFLVSMSTAIVFSLIYLSYRRGWVVFTIAGLLAVGIMVDGKLRTPLKPSVQPINIVAVQPSIPIDGNWGDDNFEKQMTLRHITLSEEELKQLLPVRIKAGEVDPPSKPITNASSGSGKPANSSFTSKTLVIWPESPMNFHYEKDDVLRSRLTNFAKLNNVYLLLNSWGVPPESTNGEGITNSALLINPSGELISRYDKIALMPFGEYVPARGWIPFMDKIPALVADIVPGKNFTLHEVAGAKLGIMICFEVTRPEIARRFRNEGASVFVQLSNESWFGPTSAARQVLSQTVFRAVENDIELIRVTNSGLSAKITSYGDVIDETQMFQPVTRNWSTGTVEDISKPETFYTRYGDVFAITCAALSGIFTIVAIVYERLKKKEDEEE